MRGFDKRQLVEPSGVDLFGDGVHVGPEFRDGAL